MRLNIYPGEFRADRAPGRAEAVVAEDPDLGEVARVVADRDGLADKGRERRLDVAQALEPDPVAVHLTRPDDGQQQKIELLQRGRQARREAVRLPPHRRRCPCAGMGSLVVVLEQETSEGHVEIA